MHIASVRCLALCLLLASSGNASTGNAYPKSRRFTPQTFVRRQIDNENWLSKSENLNINLGLSPDSGVPYEERWFTQRVDHFNDSNKDTFQQRYWIGTSFYREGGPVIVLEGGETSGFGRIPFLRTGIVRYLTEELGGIGVILEHRYYGKSNVTKNLSTDSLKYLDTAQSLADNAYFAENLWKDLPKKLSNVQPSKNPFVSYGGSYAGSKSAFLQIKYPKIYYGSIASSAVIWVDENFWEYNEPIRMYGEPKCIHIIEETANLIDELAAKGGEDWIAFKSLFGLKDVENRDFANVISTPIGMWQESNWDKQIEGSSDWDDFCSYLINGPEKGILQGGMVVLEPESESMWSIGVRNYASWIRAYVNSSCNGFNAINCFSSWDEGKYKGTDLAFDSWRLWTWQVCTEWGLFTPGAPAGKPTLIARIVDVDYLRRICKYAFGFDESHRSNITKVLQYGSFNLTAPRLMYVDGDRDPWLYCTAHSPHSPQKNRHDVLSYLIPESWHHCDENGLGDISKEPERIRKVHEKEIEVVRGWVEEFHKSHK